MKTFFKKIYLNVIPLITLQGFKNNYQINFYNNIKKEHHHIAEKTYILRHDVYCSELGFENIKKEKHEIDEHDKNSIGCLISNKKTNEGIASLRLIYQNIEKELPCLELLKRIKKEEYFKIKKQLENSNYGEISRLLILDKHRNENKNTIQLNYLLLSLYATTVVLSKNLDCIVFMCEKKMLAFFKKAELPFTYLIEEGIEHRGIRYLIKIDSNEIKRALEVEKQIIKVLKPLIKYIDLRVKKEIDID